MSLAFSDFNDLAAYMKALGKEARAASRQLRLSSGPQRNDAISAMAGEIRKAASDILIANAKDMAGGREKGLSAAMLDRLELTPPRIEAMAAGLEAIAKLPDPVGAIDTQWEQPNGLKFSKVRVPLGVIGMIYESRPNVTADAGALCVKSGNGCILRGGSEAVNSNLAIHAAMTRGLVKAGLPQSCVQYITTTDRAAVGALLGGMEGAVDLIIPRGGKNLIARVQSDARVPVLAHLEGLNHSYVHEAADFDQAIAVILNAKLRRTGVCGSTETVLIDRTILSDFAPKLIAALHEKGCEIRADQDICKLSDLVIPAAPVDFHTEHLAAIVNMAVCDNIDAALAHIDTHGSGHTDCILTQDETAAARFLRDVDSEICLHNASTQYADGGEFGFGAEIGIATGRLHARGPVGAQHLTSYKYCVVGNGHLRP